MVDSIVFEVVNGNGGRSAAIYSSPASPFTERQEPKITLTLAKGLLDNGCRVSLCLQDLSHAYEHVGNLPVHIYQSPVWLPRLRTDRQPVCFSDILMHRGYGSASGLYGLCRAWQSLYASLQPDLLMLDYAPTALLAARGSDIPKVMISSGFGERAPGLPDMCVRPWLKNGEALTRESERRVVGVVNRVLNKQGKPEIQVVSDLYRVDHCFLFIVPEVDMEIQRPTAVYLCPPKVPGNMRPALWPEGQGRRVFAYLKPSSEICLDVIQGIAELECVGLVVCSGLAKKTVTKYQRPGLTIYTDHRDVTGVMEDGDVVVCHAGRNTISEALLAGKPLLMIPEQLEQFHNSRCVSKCGAGLYIEKNMNRQAIKEALTQLLLASEFSAAAKSIALKNEVMLQADPVAQVVECCKGLLV